MIAKLITVHVRPGHLQDYLAAQRVWHAEMRRAPAFVGGFYGQAGPDCVKMTLLWRSRADYERWMAVDHDRIAARAGTAAHCHSIETEVIDAVLPCDLGPACASGPA